MVALGAGRSGRKAGGLGRTEGRVLPVSRTAVASCSTPAPRGPRAARHSIFLSKGESLPDRIPSFPPHLSQSLFTAAI